jgi:biotin operon repressor
MTTSTTATTAETVLAAVTATPGITAADLADVAGLGRSTVAKALAKLEQTGQVSRTPGGRDSGRRQPDCWSPPAADNAAAPVNGGKLGKGQLRSLVLGYLQDQPGEAHSPTAIGNALGRSSGAVGNALIKLAGNGTITETSVKPRRYTVQS